jgi:hypothetical protein
MTVVNQAQQEYLFSIAAHSYDATGNTENLRAAAFSLMLKPPCRSIGTMHTPELWVLAGAALFSRATAAVACGPHRRMASAAVAARKRLWRWTPGCWAGHQTRPALVRSPAAVAARAAWRAGRLARHLPGCHCKRRLACCRATSDAPCMLTSSDHLDGTNRCFLDVSRNSVCMQ